MLHPIRLGLISLVLALTGCSHIHPNNTPTKQSSIEQKLNGKWACPLKQEKMDHGEVSITLKREFFRNTVVDEFILQASTYTPLDTGTLVAKSTAEFSIKQNEITTRTVSGNVQQTIEPKSQALINLFNRWYSGMAMGMDWGIQAKNKIVYFVDSIDENSLRTYKIEDNKRTEEISCKRVE